MERVERSHAEAARTYDRVSRVYDWLEAPFEVGAREAGLDMLGVRSGERVLDVGHGTGHALAKFARLAGGHGLAVGVDLSPGMQAAARRRLQRTRAGAVLARSDAIALCCRSGSFDAAFMGFVLELFDTPELPAVLAEVRRVLRPGGRLGVVALAIAKQPGFVSRLYLAGHHRFPRLLDCRPIPTRALLRHAGFTIESAVTEHMWGLPVDIVVATV